MTINDKITLLGQTPYLLKELLEEIPVKLLKIRRIPGKWCIHEHVCHLYLAQPMMIRRFKSFKENKNPEFIPYLPGTAETPDDPLMKMELGECLEGFENDRKTMIQLLNTFSKEDWENEGRHPEYIKFTPEIFLRHIVMHDHLHMYRIEELWLTTDDYLRKT